MRAKNNEFFFFSAEALNKNRGLGSLMTCLNRSGLEEFYFALQFLSLIFTRKMFLMTSKKMFSSVLLNNVAFDPIKILKI